MQGKIEYLWVAVAKGKPMAACDKVTVKDGMGFEGCRHSKTQGKRQVLICDKETLAEFQLVPGQIKENVTVTGLDVNQLSVQTRLQLGAEVVLEITMPCEPCHQMDDIRPGLQAALADRRGVLCKVITPGTIHCGDSFTVLQNEQATAI